MLFFLLCSRIIYNYYLMFSRKPLDKTSKVRYNIYIKGKAQRDTGKPERTGERENKHEVRSKT